MHSQQFPYPRNPEHPDTLGLPFIPIALFSRHDSFQGQALLDSGSMVNLLPYRVGQALGAAWGSTTPVSLTGALGKLPAYALKVETQIGDFPPQILTYAWTRSDDAPLILGLVNFFLKYNVCFFAADGTIEIAPHQENQ